jgi:acyl carrier protein
MGIDFLDLVFRIENEFKVKVTQADLETMASLRISKRQDVSAGAFLELLLSRPACPSCGHSLQNQGRSGTCPLCAQPFTIDADQTWRKLQAIIAAVVQVHPEKVTRTSLLVRDLGFT